ncbi:MAG: XRE family transcriptional regulator [Ignavibacteria bacterium]|nr:XRE family transcriptional regulator [Ignavibacteria bacterium]
MKMTIGDRIRKAREEKEMDQATLAAKAGVVTRTLQRWEKGEQTPDGVAITKLARATSVQASWILTGEGDMFDPPGRPSNVYSLPVSPRTGNPLVDIPLVSQVRGGTPATVFHPDYVDDYVTVDDVRDPQAFALTVTGESMAPRIEEGDVVIVSPKLEPQSGDICVVRVNGEDTLKKIKFEGSYLHLIPLNPSFEPITVKKKEVNFVWKVVKVIKEV